MPNAEQTPEAPVPVHSQIGYAEPLLILVLDAYIIEIGDPCDHPFREPRSALAQCGGLSSFCLKGQ
jgi:hypothetical protein